MEQVTNVIDLGVTPADWPLQPLATIGKWHSGGTPSMANKTYWGGSIPWVSPKDMKVSRLYETIDHISEKAVADGARLLPAGSVLMVIRGMILAHSFPVARAERPLSCNQDIKAVVADSDFDNDYLLHWLIGHAHKIRGLTTESTHGTKRLPPEMLYRVLLPKPTKAEQEAIAGALSDADRLIESLERLIAKKRHLKQAAMQQLLTAKTRLPGFHGKWETKRLDELGDSLIGLTYKPSDVRANGILVLRSSNVADGMLRFDDNVFVDKEIPERIMVKAGDILICVRNGSRALIGKCAKISDRERGMTFGAFMAVFRTAEHDFIYHQFQSGVIKGQINEHLGATINQITNKSLNSFKVPFPQDQRERLAISAVLSEMEEQIVSLCLRLEKVRLVKHGMMQNLLTGRIRLTTKNTEVQADVPHSSKGNENHNWQINEAVVISVLTKMFGSEQFPLGRKRYTKLSYLMHRHVERRAAGYLKKAAGPYNPATKYGGPEKIALGNNYIRQHKRESFAGFVASDQIAKAETYFDKWYGEDVKAWLEQFRRVRNDDLELWATVDMAMVELREAASPVTVAGIKEIIGRHSEWLPKLERSLFSDIGIAGAIRKCDQLFGETAAGAQP